MRNVKKITVLVTAVGGRSVGQQILESLKKYKRNYRIITTDAEPFSPGLYEAEKSYITPLSTSKDFINRVLSICKKEGVQVLLPGSIPETVEISKHEKYLLKNNVVPIVNPYSLVGKTHDKLGVYKLLRKNNLLTPETRELKTVEDAEGLLYPVIVKPRGETSGSKNVHIIKDKDELTEIFKKKRKEKIKLLVQEYVGDETEEYTVGVIAGYDGRIIDTIVMKRKLIGLSKGEERNIDGRNFILSTGYSQGFIVEQMDVKKYCELAAKKLGARGPLNIQCRRGREGVYIFEVHPRFSGSASMRAEVGFNEPHVLIQEFLGIRRINKVPHRVNYAIIRKFANTVVNIKEYDKLKYSKKK